MTRSDDADVLLIHALLTRLRARWATCRCGHPVAWHRHHRPGRDCSGCGCRRPRRGGKPVRRDVSATIAAVYGSRPVDVDWRELIRRAGMS